ncbi:MAG: metallophosphoesterase N-terminal domain-containing protein, partial [Planctomycetota bacterium]
MRRNLHKVVCLIVWVGGLVEPSGMWAQETISPATPPVALPAVVASSEPAKTQVARGVVFHDTNGDGKRDAGDRPISDVKVSNGLDIVRTDAEGRYELPLGDEGQVFVIKPAGYRT